MPDEQAQDKPAVPAASAPPKCGLVMPISAIGGCDERHWYDVKAILTEAIEAAGFQANLVSVANESRIIQNTIVENLYLNDMVVCDVSCKNPNVMFELGLRLAFDRPTVVVKDMETDYSFDTSPVVHLLYPRSLRYAKIVAFKQELTDAVRSTHQAAKDPNYKTFLKTFGTIKVATIETQEVSKEDYIIQQLREVRAELQDIRSRKRADTLGLEEVFRDRSVMTHWLKSLTAPQRAALRMAVATYPFRSKGDDDADKAEIAEAFSRGFEGLDSDSSGSQGSE